MAKTSTHTVTLVDENSIEILVTFEFEKGEKQIEEGHGFHDVAADMIDLKSVEMVIAGKGIELLPLLNEDQKEKIVAGVEYQREDWAE